MCSHLAAGEEIFTSYDNPKHRKLDTDLLFSYGFVVNNPETAAHALTLAYDSEQDPFAQERQRLLSTTVCCVCVYLCVCAIVYLCVCVCAGVAYAVAWVFVIGTYSWFRLFALSQHV